MALTDLFIRKLQYKGAPSGDKYSDGRGLYLLVKQANKYWRMNYRFAGKYKTLPFGIYPEVSLADARERCADAWKAIRAGVDPHPNKREVGDRQVEEAGCTFEQLALQWLEKMEPGRSAGTQEKVATWLKHDIFPFIGNIPVATIRRYRNTAFERLPPVGTRVSEV